MTVAPAIVTELSPWAGTLAGMTNVVPLRAASGVDADARRRLVVALVTETYPPEVNGVARTLAILVDGLRARGHTLCVLRPRRDSRDRVSDPEERSFPGLPIPLYAELRMGLPARRVLERLWRAARPDLVHIATEGPLGWSALRAARALGIPVTTEFRTNFHAYSAHYGIGWLRRPIVAYLRWLHNRADCTMVPTATLARELAADGFERLQVVARGVDAQLFSPATRSVVLRREWGVYDNDVALVYVGRLAAEKNLVALVPVYDALCEGRGAFASQVRMVFVGDGPLRASLQRRCPRAIFAGQRHDEDLARHYASGDLFVFPSLTETWGNVTSEALASGLPVLAFNRAAAAELVEPGTNGMLVDPTDDHAFVRAAIRLANDPRELREMRAAARARALSLDWERIVGQVEGLMLEARSRAALPGAPVHTDVPPEAEMILRGVEYP